MNLTEAKAREVLLRFYEPDSDLFRLLWLHSSQVAQLAVDIARRQPQADCERVAFYALLHDVGIIRCHAPKIYCLGAEPYLRHGIIGESMLRNIDPNLESAARVCSRHTGAGLTKDEIIAGNLPLPHMDLLPETLEEKIICYADKFFSKSRPDHILDLNTIRTDMLRHGEAQLQRFDALHSQFGK